MLHRLRQHLLIAAVIIVSGSTPTFAGGRSPGGTDQPGGSGPRILSISAYFDWENAEYVNNDPATGVRLPWRSGASTGVPRAISLDMRREDGWTLVHNAFGTGADEPNKLLILYNKFTGVLRVWYYHREGNEYSTLKYGIQLAAPSGLFNFDRDFARPMDVRTLHYVSETISGNWGEINTGGGLAANTWYLFDFALAYDSNVRNLSPFENDLILYTRGIDITALQIEGTQNGTIKGRITLSAPGTNLFNISNLKISGGQIVDNSNQSVITNSTATETTKDSQSWWQRVKQSLASSISSKIGDAGGALAKSVLNLVTTPVGNLLNSLIHQGLSDRGTVDLTLTTRIKLDGQLTLQRPVTENNLYVPGSYMDPATNLVYLYPEAMGVFNVSTQPLVEYAQTYYSSAGSGPPMMMGPPYPNVPRVYAQFFQIDRSSFDIVVNPAITSEVDVLTSKSELYFYEAYNGSTALFWNAAWIFNDACCGGLTVAGELVNTSERNRWYRLEEGMPFWARDTSFGIRRHGVPPYYDVPVRAEGRVVVKVTLRLRVKATGRVITHVRTYLPRFVDTRRYPIVSN